MDAAAQKFFTSPLFAVAGASQSPHKFGHKVLAWYHSRSLPVVPITPSTPSITISSTEYATIASPLELPHPAQTSLSIITPPAVTLKLLREAKEVGVSAVWMQPGSFDGEGLEFARREFEGAAVAGEGGKGGEGWCVLVDGDEAVEAAREERGKL